MVQFTELPDGWREIEYDTGPKRGDAPYTEELEAMWVSEDDKIRMTCRHSVDADGQVTYPVMVEQHVAGNGYKTTIQSHGRVADDRQDAEKKAVEFMEQVNDGEHTLRVLGVEMPDEMDFVQFYTLSDSELPEGMTADQLIDAIESNEDGNDIDDLPDEITREFAKEEMVQIDVFPRHESEVEETDET